MNVRYEKEGAIAVLTLDRPERLNAMAEEMAESATYALALAKKMFQSMYGPTLEQLMELETLASGAARLTRDHKEGVDAFKEKRPPKFLGK